MLYRSRLLVWVLAVAALALLPAGCTLSSLAPGSAPQKASAGGSAEPSRPDNGGSSPARPGHAAAPVPVTPADPQWGNVDAPVSLVEVSDFQCPFCADVQTTLEQLKTKYGPERLRIVWKHNPLPFHERARPAHEVAAAVFMLAGSTAFFRFHDLAFANQAALTPENLELWASRVGVSPAALTTWLASGRAQRKVDEDVALAERIGASGTPGFRINGVSLSGAQPLEEFVRVVDEQLAAARKLTLSGSPPGDVYPLLTSQNFAVPRPEAPATEADEVEGAVFRIPVAADDPVRGPADALVTIVQFSDFECPFCQRVDATLKELLRLYGKDVRLVWKDHPLPFHERALPAASLARAAYTKRGNEGFWRVHDALFASHPDLSDETLTQIAKNQGLLWAPLAAALAKGEVPAKLTESVELAADFKARGTPHFFVNGTRLSGAQPLEIFKERVEAQLVKARALLEQGIARSQVYAWLMKTAEEPEPPEQKTLPLRAGAAARGPATAPVVIQQFSDFECPFCGRVLPTLTDLEREFKGRIRIVWRHLPLPFHEHAQLAAEAAEEVLAQQGQAAFWAYHDRLFKAQAEPQGLERGNLRQLAASLGVDLVRFDAALDRHTHEATVKADQALAEQAGINGTPAFLINDYYLSGAQPTAAFRKLVVRALRDKQRRK